VFISAGCHPNARGRIHMPDPFNLDRFLAAQNPHYGRILGELRSGRKQSHWMWFVFPQLKGLGASRLADYYGIGGLSEAEAYLDHPVLGARLRECTTLVNGLHDATALQIFGMPDTLKFRSSMTLFEVPAGSGSVFAAALERYFEGQRDDRTLALLGRAG
jgi:uncharacterized protein (DUF1810 family)